MNTFYEWSVLDLFAGAGGFSHGFHSEGFHTRTAIDYNPDAIDTLIGNFDHLGTEVIQADLSSFSPIKCRNYLEKKDITPHFDVIIGGPPCQGWSSVGRGKLRSLAEQRGKSRSYNDPRNELFKSFIKYVKFFQPKVCVMENVPGMLSYNNKNAAEVVEDLLEKAGYIVSFNKLNTSDYGLPQVRERLFFVGVRKDINKIFEFPEPYKQNGSRNFPETTVEEAIGDLPAIKHGTRDWISEYKPRKQSKYSSMMRKGADPDVVFDHVCRTHNEQDLEAFKLLKQGGWYRDLPKRLQRYRADIFEDKYKKLYWKRPSWCVTAHLEKDCYTHIHPHQPRTISIREAARLQSFPDYYYLSGNLGSKFRLIGNAVPPLIAKVLAKEIKTQIFTSKSKKQSKRTSKRESEVNV